MMAQPVEINLRQLHPAVSIGGTARGGFVFHRWHDRHEQGIGRFTVAVGQAERDRIGARCREVVPGV